MVTARQALGARRMLRGYKAEVIAYLAASDVPAAQRRRWYREWCKAVFEKCRPEDLARVAPGKPREVQLGLLED
jgi:hypothetical protein